MLRSLVLALALGAPTMAMAEDFPESPLHQEVRGHDGTVLGRIEAVQRDEDGNITGVEIPGLEPGSAPRASRDLVAERNDEYVPVRDRGGDTERLSASDARLRLR